MTSSHCRLPGCPLPEEAPCLEACTEHPEQGTVLVPFGSVEATSLYEALVSCFPEGDASGHLHLAEICSSRGLVDLALRELHRAVDADPLMQSRADEVGATICEQAADRRLHEAREHMRQGRRAHARAALDDLLRKFPSCQCTEEAREFLVEVDREVTS
ncbi:MAG: tetratricopeptide repeat protein [Planctomycetota bacterium]|jgi:hypothetical protein